MKKLSGICLILLFFMSFPVISQQPETVQDTTEDVQETKYVTDKLRLSLYKQADAGSGTIKLLVSGDRLDVLGRSGPYSKVRTLQGEVGWVKNGFLVNKPTASNLLQDMEQKIAQLESQLEKFSDSKTMVAQYENSIQGLTQEKQILATELTENQRALQRLQQKNTEISAQLEKALSGDNLLDWQTIETMLIEYWYFILAIVLFCFFMGLIIGRKMIEAQVNRRFQGVKVI